MLGVYTYILCITYDIFEIYGTNIIHVIYNSFFTTVELIVDNFDI